MSALTPRLLVVLLALVAGAILTEPLGAQDPYPRPRFGRWDTSCECRDVPDLLNRLNMAHAAVDRYRRESEALRAEMAQKPVVADAVPEGQSRTNLELLQDAVRDAQIEVQDPDASTGVNARTYPWWFCYSHYSMGNAPSGCMLRPLSVHESIHVAACQAHRDERGALVSAFTEALPVYVIDRVREEITAYEAEIAELLRLLRALPDACRPRGWVGVIQATETKRTVITLTHKPSNPLALVSEQTTDTQFNRFGAIRVRERAVSASWTSAELTTVDHKSGMQLSCSGGLKTPIPDRTQRNTHHRRSNGHGDSREVPTVEISAPLDALTYTIGFQLPAMTARLRVEGFDAESGGCADKSVPIAGEVQDSAYSASSHLLVDQPKAPRATVLQGMQRFDLLPFRVQVPGMTSQHTIEVTWHLHEID